MSFAFTPLEADLQPRVSLPVFDRAHAAYDICVMSRPQFSGELAPVVRS